MNDWTPPDEWLVVFEKDGSQSRVEVQEESAIDGAVSAYLESGKDALLHLMFVEGYEYVIRASQITSWFVSNPEFRSRAESLDRKVKEEKRANGWSDDG